MKEKLSNEELDRLAAIEVMGFVVHESTVGECFNEYLEPGQVIGVYIHPQPDGSESWHPCTDRNQSRQVVEAATKLVSSEKMPLDGRGLLLSAFSSLGVFEKHMQESAWTWATPRQEVEAALMAIRQRLANRVS